MKILINHKSKKKLILAFIFLNILFLSILIGKKLKNKYRIIAISYANEKYAKHLKNKLLSNTHFVFCQKLSEFHKSYNASKR